MQNYAEIQALNQQIQTESAFVDTLKAETARVIVGQEYMIERLLIGLLTRGHILLEGMPDWPKRWLSRPLHKLLMPVSVAYSSRRTCCPPMWWAP
jgi:MoxR-like ATPase